jgi:glycerophosphoryl diester phosphodiesterase
MKSQLIVFGLWGLVLTGVTAMEVSAQERGVLPKGLRKPKHGDVYVVAHRGVHDSIPENTMAAYRKAIELNCDFIEVDIRTTRDGHLVSIHDATIDRYSIQGEKGKVVDLTLDQLRGIDIGSRVDPKWSDERVPTLEEILQLCRGRIGIYLDIKSASLQDVLKLVRKYEMESDTLWYMPASQVEQLRGLSSLVWPMPDPGPEKFLPELLAKQQLKVVASMAKYFSPSFARQVHEHDAIVIVDEKDPTSWNALLNAGADGIQTDHPEKLIRFLKQLKKADRE